MKPMKDLIAEIEYRIRDSLDAALFRIDQWAVQPWDYVPPRTPLPRKNARPAH